MTATGNVSFHSANSQILLVSQKDFAAKHKQIGVIHFGQKSWGWGAVEQARSGFHWTHWVIEAFFEEIRLTIRQPWASFPEDGHQRREHRRSLCRVAAAPRYVFLAQITPNGASYLWLWSTPSPFSCSIITFSSLETAYFTLSLQNLENSQGLAKTLWLRH